MPTIDRNKLLGIDTTTDNIVVGLGDRIVTLPAKRKHSDRLLPEIDRLLKLAKMTPDDLAGVVVAIGPGNFTGLRVGVVVANGIGYAKNKPVAGCNEFERVRLAGADYDVILLDAGRDQVFAWSARNATPALIDIAQVGKWVLAGDSVYIDTPELVAKLHFHLQAAGTIYIGPIGLEDRMRSMLGKTKMARTVREVEPLYLRGANITKAKAKG